MTRIESERRKIGINKAQLADHLGVSGSAVSQWENKGKQPSAKNYAKMAKLFGVSVDYLRGTDDTPTYPKGLSPAVHGCRGRLSPARIENTIIIVAFPTTKANRVRERTSPN